MVPSAREKAVVSALMGWSCFFMLGSGMRLVAPALMYGLAFALVPPRRKNSVSPTAVVRKSLRNSPLITN